MSGERKAELIGLILKARSGSESALGELIKRYDPLIASLMSKHFTAKYSEADVEDVRQELLVIFCNAVMKFDTEQSDVDFGLYAKICMERCLISQLRAIGRRVAVEQMLDDNIPHFDDPSLGVIENESIQEMHKLISNNLSEYENAVWELHLSGKSAGEIAEKLRRDVKSIDNALCRIRAKLRKALKQ